MLLLTGVKTEEVCFIPSDTSRNIITVFIVVANVCIEGGIAVKCLCLTNCQATVALRAIIDQTLPPFVIECLPVHARGSECRFIITIHQLLNITGGPVFTQLKAHDCIHVMLIIQKCLVKIQLTAESITIAVVRLLEIVPAFRKQLVPVHINKSISRDTHLVGGRVIIGLTACLPPFVLIHHVEFKTFQKAHFRIHKRPDS